MTKHPRKVIKHTIAMWNHFGRTMPGWPAAMLSSPFVSEPDTLPLDRFPESFRADVARWTERMTQPDPLDPEAPVRPLKPATIDGYIVFFRRFGSALVRRDIVPIDEVTGLAVFFEGSNFKEVCGTSCRRRAAPGTPHGDGVPDRRRSSAMSRGTTFGSMRRCRRRST